MVREVVPVTDAIVVNDEPEQPDELVFQHSRYVMLAAVEARSVAADQDTDSVVGAAGTAVTVGPACQTGGVVSTPVVVTERPIASPGPPVTLIPPPRGPVAAGAKT